MPTHPVAGLELQSENMLYGSPISSLLQVTGLPSWEGRGGLQTPPSNLVTDFIARGLISDAEAQQLFHIFVTRLDHFCYDIMCPHQTLKSLRKSSALLTAAICTVSALHDPDSSAVFRICHAEFLRLVTSRMFSHDYSTDDIRALIVGSYWLGDITYTLVGHAIRIATSLNYHLAYYAAIQGDRPAFETARLWYVLYIMDHHLSILYGRPAIIAPNQEPYQQWERFIQSEHGDEPDVRMSSQVALYHVTSKAKSTFGAYHGRIPEHSLYQLQGHFSDLDRWYMTWGNRMQRNAYVGNFPTDGAILHYHFARLHLCSYIFRGMTTEAAAHVSDQVKEYAVLALSSATAVLELVLERTDLRNALVGMPIYFHAMIVFAAVFLVKAASTNFLGLSTVDDAKVFNLLEQCVREMRSQSAASQHLIYHLGSGLESMISKASLAKTRLDLGVGAPQEHMPMAPAMDSLFMLDASDLFQYPLESGGQLSSENEYHWFTHLGS
ncbi:hypothetical protein P170DRAFT_42324 [Aspergillus steynii IBT 23096]|uniref:Xylanolytic transcriptional activator regulatory domain-containing protein n=1 Tax=Aspergillus steynii IBT 23096 TaxID=1392250 RepID=A0A2I2GRJ1_9EURO|nr:uncharacterized protein P170DRAFT_42324 [Aspergillus steynii IBT 23096]PLB55491.1 hypothetical protein P170DRAFT_42324 [Aspergillus steynii IBT 23096]